MKASAERGSDTTEMSEDGRVVRFETTCRGHGFNFSTRLDLRCPPKLGYSLDSRLNFEVE